MRRELVLVISGASGGILPARLAQAILEIGDVCRLHVVMTEAASKVLSLELGADWATAEGFCAQVGTGPDRQARLCPWSNDQLDAPIASGSYPVHGTIVLPCSAGMVGSLAAGISRGLGQRAADVALKQRWPLIIGVRETPMSIILLENLTRLARAGAHIVPPLPAFYVSTTSDCHSGDPGPDPAAAWQRYLDHYCMRVLDLLGLAPEIASDTSSTGSLRWKV